MKNAHAILLASAILLGSLLLTAENLELRRAVYLGSAALFGLSLAWMLWRGDRS